MGGGGSKSKQDSSSSGSQKSYVSPDQIPYLQDLWGNAGRLWQQSQQQFPGFQNFAGQMGDYNRGVATEALPAWQQQLQGGATAPTAAAVNPALQQSLQESMTGPSKMGQMYESIVGGSGNTYIDPMVDAMKAGVQRSMERNVLPTIDAGAVGAGQSGSSRHGIAQGLAMSDAQRDMMDQETKMRGGAYDKDLQMKMAIARQADTNIGGAQQRAIDLMNSQNKAQSGAISAGGDLQNLGMGSLAPGMAGAMLPWQMMGQYMNTIGRPTVVGSGSQSGSSSGKSGGKSGGIV